MADRAHNNRRTEPGAPAPRAEALGRMLALKIGLLVLFAAVACRLAQIQVLDAGRYQELARRQSEVRVTLPAARGNVYDRNGTLLVSNAVMVSLGADPKMIGSDAAAFATRLARVFEHPRRYYQEKLESDRRFVYLERRVKPQLARLVNAAEFDGVIAKLGLKTEQEAKIRAMVTQFGMTEKEKTFLVEQTYGTRFLVPAEDKAGMKLPE